MTAKIRVDKFIWGKKASRRKQVPISIQKKVILRSKGACERCDLDFSKKNVRSRIHHRDGNQKSNQPSNLLVRCPNCHDELHAKTERKKKEPRKELVGSVTDYILG